MITSAVCNSAKVEWLQGIHTSTDVYKIALYTSKASLGEKTVLYLGANEVTGPGYTVGGQVLSGFSVGMEGTTATLSFNNPTWEDASITARGALIYNSSKENRAIAVVDFEKDVISTNGPFLVRTPEGLIKLL